MGAALYGALSWLLSAIQSHYLNKRSPLSILTEHPSLRVMRGCYDTVGQALVSACAG